MLKHLLAIAISVMLAGVANGDATINVQNQERSLRGKPSPHLLGGATTVADISRNAFSRPARNLSILRRDNFFIGNAFFKQPWVIAPASTSARDGLGSLFNANTCQGCHVKDGRGRPPLKRGESFQSILVRLSIPATTPAQQAQLKKFGAIPEPNYGDQLQPNGIPGVKGEATPHLSYQTIGGQFNDGTGYTLLKPKLRLLELNYGELHKDVQTSLRVAPKMPGLGLLQAIPEADILALADPEDTNNDGISGRPNRVWDITREETVLGRFGWKASQPSVAQQSAGAFTGDMGLTSAMFPTEACTATQLKCQQAPSGGKPEVSSAIMNAVVFYTSTLAVPARRNIQDQQVLHGERLFHRAGCASCHVTGFQTGKVDGFPELSNQLIHPYTDLLLHDMGEGLADNHPGFIAEGHEWRTAPLWGIGLVKTVNGHTRFLHDGRARNLMEAVLWHGGEAEQAKQSVLAMDKTERDALIDFLESL